MSSYLNSAVLPPGLQPKNPEGLWHYHTLLPVVGRRDTLEELKTLKSCRTASSLVGDHAADRPVKDLRGSAVVEGTRLFGIDDMTLVQEVVVPELQDRTSRLVRISHSKSNGMNYLVAEEAAGDINLLAPDDDNLLAIQNLLGDNRRQSSKEMALAINDDGGRGEGGHGESVGRVEHVKLGR